MALSLLGINQCSFSNCGLYFANQYDLIAHIEFNHIPPIEEEHRQKSAQSGNDENRVNLAPNLPLSCFQRVFPQPYNPKPVPPKRYELSFCHFKRKAPTASGTSHLSNNHVPPPPSAVHSNGHATMSYDEEVSNDSVSNNSNVHVPIDLEECAPEDPEIRFRCNYMDCGKRYRAAAGLRNHLRLQHGISSEESPATSGSGEPSSSGIPSANSSPTKYAQSRPHKCQYCSKRYKTPTGLQNHVSQAHQKPNSSQSPSPSPQAIADIILRQGQSYKEREQKPLAQVGLQQPTTSISNLLPVSTGTTNASTSSLQNVPTNPNNVAPVRLVQAPLPVSVAAQLPPVQSYHNPQGNAHPVNTAQFPVAVRSVHLSSSGNRSGVNSSQVGLSNANNITAGQLLHQQYLQSRKDQQRLQQQQQQLQMHSQQVIVSQYGQTPNSQNYVVDESSSNSARYVHVQSSTESPTPMLQTPQAQLQNSSMNTIQQGVVSQNSIPQSASDPRRNEYNDHHQGNSMES